MGKLRKERKRNGGYVYYVDFVFKGKRYHRSTHTDDRKLAQRILDEVQGEIARGAFNIEDLEENNLTITEFRKEYIEGHCRVEIAKGTVLIYDQALKDLEVYIGGNTVLRMVTETMARSFRTHLTTKIFKREGAKHEGRRLSPSTINMKIRSLRTAWNWAMIGDRKYVKENVWEGINFLTIDKSIVRAMKPEELNQVFELAEADGERGRKFAAYMKFLLMTGCRRNEAINLKWGEIDFRSGFVTFGKTKTHQGRVVPVNNELKKILAEMLKDNLTGDMNAQVFDFDPNYVTCLFIKYKHILGLDPRIKLHSFRHTAAMIMRMKGIEIMDIKDMLGHKDIETTMIYAKAFPALLRPASKAISFEEFRNAGKDSEDAKEKKRLTP